MHWLWFFLLRKRQFSWLLMATLIVAGVYTVMVIPKESAPEVIVPIGIVSTTYPGVTARDMEELVTNKLEDQIKGIENLDTLTSESRDGISFITAQFDADANIDESIQNLKDAVDIGKTELPEDANDPFVSEVNFQDQPILILAISAELPPVEFTRLSEELKDEFSGVDGVSKVTVQGVRGREIQVVLNEDALLATGVDVRTVRDAIAGANLSFPIGAIETGGVEYAVRFEGDIQDVGEIRNIPIASRNGAIIFVRDIATVYDNVERETTLSRVSIAGEPSENAMTLAIYKRAGYDVTLMSDGVKQKLGELQNDGDLLSESKVLLVFDQGEFVKRDLKELITTGFETVILVTICLLLTIGWRESLVAAISIPLSFVIAFIGLYASGNTINFVSLFSLILAIGILVDSGIVVIEAIHTRLQKYGDPMEAARASIKEYSWPLIGGTMTTVAVFVPLFFLSGIIGEFIKSIPFTIIFVLIASIVVALGMVPLIAISFTESKSSSRFEELQEEYTHKAQAWYKMKLLMFFRNVKAQRIFLWSLALGFVFALVLPVVGFLKVIFFPPEDVDYVYIELEAVQGTPIKETDLSLRAVEEILYEKEYVASFTSTVGAGSQFTGGTNSGGKFANITVNLLPTDDREIDSAEIALDLREALLPINNVIVTIFEQENGPPSGAPVTIKFLGENLEELARVTNVAESILKEIPGTIDVTASTKSSATELVLTVDRDKAALFGISPAAVGETLRGVVFGITSTSIRREGEDIDVVVKLNVERDVTDFSAIPKVTLDTLRGVEISSPNGPVSLSSILTTTLSVADASIAHEEQKRVGIVGAYTLPGANALEITNAFKAREEELDLGDDITVSYGGETEDINESFREMFVALIAGLLLMLAILVLAFNSIRYSLYLLLTVPLSLIGVFGGLALTGQSLSFTSLLGVIALAGVIINHAIILMDSMLNHLATEIGKDLAEVVADSAVSRLRPIFLTTITTVVGMIPLSTISSFWSPLAFTIMFGLTFAMILTLVLVPTLFYRSEKRKLERVALKK